MPKVLLVDDNKNIIDLTEEMLSEIDGALDIMKAPDGAAAVKIAAAEIPDLIFMDINMPVMDGIRAVAVIRGNPRTKNIPVVALSTEVSLKAPQHHTALGFNAFLAKPASSEALQAAVDQFICRASIEPRAAS